MGLTCGFALIRRGKNAKKMKTPGFGTASIKKVNADALPHRPGRNLLGGP
jgi:hypothetical protein